MNLLNNKNDQSFNGDRRELLYKKKITVCFQFFSDFIHPSLDSQCFSKGYKYKKMSRRNSSLIVCLHQLELLFCAFTVKKEAYTINY